MHIDILFFITLFFLGVCTSYTDIKTKNIFNIHLLCFACIGCFLIIVKFFFHLPVQTHFINAFFASILSIVFFLTKIWCAGDAKLFILYALLMPTLPYPIMTAFSFIHHMAITFLLGTLFLIPYILKDILKHQHIILPKIFSKDTLEILTDSFFMTLCICWIILPLLNMIEFFHRPFISFLSIYGLYIILYRLLDRFTEYRLFVWGLFLIGLIIRIFLSPQFFTLQNILHFLLITFCYSLIFKIFFLTIETLKSTKERIPFAPFLFIGCFLSYTNFLQQSLTIIRTFLKN